MKRPIQVAVRSKWPSAAQFNGTPWWVWTGGLLGAFNVLAPVLLVGRLGTTLLFAAIITGQLICSLVIDQLGCAGSPAPPSHPSPAVRVGLVVCRRLPRSAVKPIDQIRPEVSHCKVA